MHLWNLVPGVAFGAVALAAWKIPLSSMRDGPHIILVLGQRILFAVMAIIIIVSAFVPSGRDVISADPQAHVGWLAGRLRQLYGWA
jgi:hypothetical protein